MNVWDRSPPWPRSLSPKTSFHVTNGLPDGSVHGPAGYRLPPRQWPCAGAATRPWPRWHIPVKAAVLAACAGPRRLWPVAQEKSFRGIRLAVCDHLPDAGSSVTNTPYSFMLNPPKNNPASSNTNTACRRARAARRRREMSHRDDRIPGGSEHICDGWGRFCCRCCTAAEAARHLAGDGNDDGAS